MQSATLEQKIRGRPRKVIEPVGSLKVYERVLRDCRMLAAIRGEPIGPMMNDLIEPLVSRLLEAELAKRNRKKTGAG
jgi:hypothetical protein